MTVTYLVAYPAESREREPLNLESPLRALESFLTPNELFYVRNHFSTPKLHIASYELRIDKAVGNPFAVSYIRIAQDAVAHMRRHARVCGE